MIGDGCHGLYYEKPVDNKFANDNFPVFTPPKSHDSPGFVVWESDDEEEEELKPKGRR